MSSVQEHMQHETAIAPATFEKLTAQIATFSSGLRYEDIPPEASTVAKHCLLDWLAVSLAGSDEPLVHKLRKRVTADGGHTQATLVGGGQRVSTSQATLVNGSAGHALDYDDVLRPLSGHPTVPVAPVVMALGEREGFDGKSLLTAFVSGVEVESRVGLLMGESHYARGWHATATVGTFGAAAAASRLLGLDPARTAQAFGIAATQAAGLKSVFGTMCKPLHAGKAASNGLLAAELAADGFSSRDDILECEQGFAATQTSEPQPALAIEALGQRFFTQDTRFKYHAACYGTHPPIEAARKIRAMDGFDPEAIERIDVTVAHRCLAVCNITEPQTGLQMKFSLRMTVAMALAGIDTAALQSFDDALAQRPELLRLRDKVVVIGDSHCARDTAEVAVTMRGGSGLRASADLSEPVRDLALQGERLEAKFRSLATPRIGASNAEAVIEGVRQIDTVQDVRALMRLVAATAA